MKIADRSQKCRGRGAPISGDLLKLWGDLNQSIETDPRVHKIRFVFYGIAVPFVPPCFILVFCDLDWIFVAGILSHPVGGK